MQSHTTVYHQFMVKHTHPGVNILIHQTEKYSLIANHCLVMTFRITDGMLFRTFIGQFIKHIPHMPFFIFFAFNQLNPIIRHSHAHPKIKPYSPFTCRLCQTRHSAHIFSNSNHVRIYFMNQFISQRQISNRILILIAVIIKLVFCKITP